MAISINDGLDELMKQYKPEEKLSYEPTPVVRPVQPDEQGTQGNVQLKNGYIRIAHELFQVLTLSKLYITERNIIDIIIMHTWSWRYKWANIPLNKFSSMTGVNKSNISRALKKLIDENIIKKKVDKGRNMYSFNKRWNTWKIDIPNSDDLKKNRVEIRNTFKTGKLRKN